MNKKYTYMVIILLTVATLAAFGRIADNDFINFDDQGYITENDYIKTGINSESIEWALKTIVLSNWHPLTMVSHILDWSLFGRDASGHHIVSLLLHIGAVIFLFLFLNKATGNIWPSAFAAAFFALHPLRVESVAWAAERKDVLSMFFGMAALYAYTFYAQSSKLSCYFLCLILFTLSLLSKSMLITLPVVFLLLDYWPLGRWKKEITSNKNRFLNKLVAEKIPFFLLTILFSIMTIWTQYEIVSIQLPSYERIANAIISYTVYLEKTFWPADLAVFYPFKNTFILRQIIFSSFLLIGITIISIYFFEKMPFLIVGWFWYLGTLIPVIGLVPFGTQALADRYTYLPSIGIAAMLSWGIPSIIRSEKIKRKVIFPAAIIVMGILVILTSRQCGYWKNSVDLWNHATTVTRDNVTAYSRLGHAYMNLGQNKKAIENFKKVIRLDPKYLVGYNRLGMAYSNLGEYQLAIENFNEALLLKPDYVDAYNNRAVVYFILGNINLGCNDARRSCKLGICRALELAISRGYCR